MMKKSLFPIVCLLVLLISGCSKEEIVSPKEEQLFPVRFHVSTFSTDMAPFKNSKMNATKFSSINASAANSEPLEAIDWIYYRVYDQAGELAAFKGFWAYGDPFKPSTERVKNFGIIDDSLPAGNFTVLVFGAKKGNIDIGSDSYRDGFIEFEHSTDDEIFLHKFSISVDDESTDHAVSLKRIVGKLELNILDELPLFVSKIEYSISNVGRYYEYSSGTASRETSYKSTSFENIPFGDPRRQNLDLSMFFFVPTASSSYPCTVNIKVISTSGKVIVERTVNNVPISMNKRTIISGKLFDNFGPSEQSLKVSVNESWETGDHQIDM